MPQHTGSVYLSVGGWILVSVVAWLRLRSERKLLASIPGAMVGAFAGIFGPPAIIFGFCLFVITGTFGYGWIVIRGAFNSLFGRK